MNDVVYVADARHVVDNLLRLHSYAAGSREERQFHFDRVFNAEHQVYHSTEDGALFAPVKWCGALNNSRAKYSETQVVNTEYYRTALKRIGFRAIRYNDTAYHDIYSQFLEFCYSFGFKISRAGLPHSDSKPRSFWASGDASPKVTRLYPEEITNVEGLVEGAAKMTQVIAYERSGRARLACIAHYGWSCQACGVDFESRYGDLGTGFIHVHHIRQLSEIRGEYKVDPVADLRPVCPNCHAMIHRRDPPLSIEEVSKHIRSS